MQLVMSLIFIFASFFAPTSEKEKKPFIVVELFTSEGCSSCPPADRLLSEIVDASYEDVEVIGLSFHVDYWDYIGWKDPYADKDFTRRQRAYARKFHSNQVYTPQMVVNGKHEFVGSDKSKWRNLFNELKGEQNDFTIDVTKIAAKADQLTVEISSEDARNVLLNIAVVERGLSQRVIRGENRGKVLMHDNVVRSFKTRQFNGEKNRFELEIAEDLELKNCALVVYLQDENTWEIMGAKTYPL